MNPQFIRLTPIEKSNSKELVVNVSNIRAVWTYQDRVYKENDSIHVGTRILLVGEEEPWVVIESVDEIMQRFKNT